MYLSMYRPHPQPSPGPVFNPNTALIVLLLNRLCTHLCSNVSAICHCLTGRDDARLQHLDQVADVCSILTVFGFVYYNHRLSRLFSRPFCPLLEP